MVFTALSSFNGVGINTLRTLFKQLFYILPCLHFLFIYLFIYLYYFIFCFFSSQGGIRLFNVSSVKIINFNGKIVQ